MKEFFCLILISIVALSGCSQKKEQEQESVLEEICEEENSFTNMVIPISMEERPELSVWMAYWDMDSVVCELEVLGEQLTGVSYFEAYLDPDYHVVLSEGYLEICKELKVNAKETYLTIVNDVIYDSERENSLKDIDALYALFETEGKMKEHIEEIISITKSIGASGVEIDYERIRNDMELWTKFEVFLEMLAQCTANENLKLRIILEPLSPFEQLQLPKEAEYFVMCYNLHGGRQDIGGKADKAFIKEMVEKMHLINGGEVSDEQLGFAIATGGFDWTDNGNKVTAITQVEAENIIRSFKTSKVIREPESYVRHFKYKDQDGEEHEIWFADGITLKKWIQWICEDYTYKIALWRLGGNTQEALEAMLD